MGRTLTPEGQAAGAQGAELLDLQAGAEGRQSFLKRLHAAAAGDNTLSKCCAVRAMAQIGADDEPTAAILIDSLLDGDEDVRMDAAAAIGRLRVGSSVDALVANLTGDPDGDVRAEVVKSLARIGTPETVAPLIDCVLKEGYPELDQRVDDLDAGACWDVQAEAIEALGVIGDVTAVDPIISLLDGGEFDDLQEPGFRVLARLDSDRARHYLLGKLAKGSAQTRRRAARALGTLPEISGEAGAFHADVQFGLADALLDKDATVRLAAARALGQSGNPLAVSTLTLLLTDPDAEVKREVAGILAAIGGRDVVGRLIDQLPKAGTEDRRAIVRVLGEIGDPAAVRALIAALKSVDPKLVLETVRAIGQVGEPGAEEQLVEILANSEQPPNLRVHAALALGQVVRSLAPPPVQDLVEDGEAEGDEPAPLSPRDCLLSAAFAEDEQIAKAALSAIALADPAEAASLFTGLLSGIVQDPTVFDADEPAEEPEVITIGDPKTSTLAAILTQRLEGVAREAADAEGEADTDAAGIEAEDAEAVEADITPEPAPLSIRVHAATLLGNLVDPGAEALTALIAAAGDEAEELQRAALAALGRVGDETARSTLNQALVSESLEIRLVAIDGLTGGLWNGQVEARLMQLLDDAEPFVRERVVRIVAERGGAVSAEWLLRVLADDEIAVCRAGLMSANNTKADAQVGEAIRTNLFRFSGELRRPAGQVLRAHIDEPGLRALLEILDDDAHEAFHWMCLDGLAEVFEIADHTA